MTTKTRLRLVRKQAVVAPRVNRTTSPLRQLRVSPLAPIHDRRIPVAQRQAMVRRMGQVYGNQFVQRIVGHEPMLRNGSSGPAVTTLQQHLVEAGAAIQVDGIFGPQTYRSVTAYQRAAGLSVDGIVGPNTWASLKSGSVTITDISTGGGGSQAAEVVSKLKKVKTILHRLNTEHPDVPQPQTVEPPTPEPAHHEHTHSHDSDEEETSGWFDDWFSDDSESEQQQQQNQDGGGGSSWWDSITDWVSETMQSVMEAIRGLTSQVSRELDRVSDRVKSIFRGPLEMLRDLIRGGFGEDAARKLDEIIDGLSDRPDGAEERPVSGEIPDIIGASFEASGCGDTVLPKGKKRRRMQLSVTTIPATHQGDVQDSDWGHDRLDGSSIWARTNIGQGGEVKSGWGHTKAQWNVTSIRWTLEDDVVKVNACIVVDTLWNISNNGCTDVPGSQSDVVRPDNWHQIVSELTPAEYGAPKRVKYWSSHITRIHELFHANEYYTYTKQILPEKVAEFNKETLEVPWWITDDDKRDIDTRVMITLFGLSRQLDEEVFYYVKKQGGEARAYGDGKPLYQKLVDNIKQRAENQGWPKPKDPDEEKEDKKDKDKKK